MSDATPTPEQQSAFRRMDDHAKSTWGGQMLDDWKDLVAALPDALTNPQPVLPTEPGAYHDAHGTLTIIDPRGQWHGTYGDPINPKLCPGPFTRLVPERPEPTSKEIREAWGVSRESDNSIPREPDGRMLAADAYQAGYKAGVKR